MSGWGSNTSASAAVDWMARTIQQGSGPANIAANNTHYANLTPNSILAANVVVNGVLVQQVAVTQNTFAHSTVANNLPGTGWVLKRTYTGSVTGATASGGTGYAVGDTITVSGANAVTNAVLTVAAQTAGNPSSLTVTTPGNMIGNSGFTYTTSGAGTGAEVTLTIGGGRMGRVTYEQLVAISSIANGNVIAQP